MRQVIYFQKYTDVRGAIITSVVHIIIRNQT